MQKIELTVHEFMSVMGGLDERLGGKQATGTDSLYNAWYAQWKALDERLEELGPMERANMLFDGKVSVNAISEGHFIEFLAAVREQIAMHKRLIEEDDEDADPEDMELWETRFGELQRLHDSSDWSDQI
jgi:hypothetical protein